MRSPAVIFITLIFSLHVHAAFPVPAAPNKPDKAEMRPEPAVDVGHESDPDKGIKGGTETKGEEESDTVSTRECEEGLARALKSCPEVKNIQSDFLFQKAAYTQTKSINSITEKAAHMHQSNAQSYEQQAKACAKAIDSCVKTCKGDLARTSVSATSSKLRSTINSCITLDDDRAKIEKAKADSQEAEQVARNGSYHSGEQNSNEQKSDESSGSKTQNKSQHPTSPRPGSLVPEGNENNGTPVTRESRRAANPYVDPPYPHRMRRDSAEYENTNRVSNPPSERAQRQPDEPPAHRSWNTTNSELRGSDSPYRRHEGDGAGDDGRRSGSRGTIDVYETRFGNDPRRGSIPDTSAGSHGMQPRSADETTMSPGGFGAVGMPAAVRLRAPASRATTTPAAAANAMRASASATAFGSGPQPAAYGEAEFRHANGDRVAGSEAAGHFRDSGQTFDASLVSGAGKMMTMSMRGDGSFRAGGGARTGSWQPSRDGAKLDPRKPYDGRPKIDSDRLLNQSLMVSASSGAGGGASGGARRRPDQRPLNLPDYLPNGSKYRPQHAAGSAPNNQGFQTKSVDIWSQITNRFHAHCLTGRLRDCQLDK